MKFALERVDLSPATLIANFDGPETDEEIHNGIVLAADVANNIATSSAMVFFSYIHTYIHPSIHTTRNIHVRIIFCCVCTTCILNVHLNIPKAFAHIVQWFTSSLSIHPTFLYSPESTVSMNILLTFRSLPTILNSSSVMERIRGSVNSNLIYWSKARIFQDFSPLKIVVASPPSSLEAVKLCLECTTRKADNDKEDIDRRCCICNAIPFQSRVFWWDKNLT